MSEAIVDQIAQIKRDLGQARCRIISAIDTMPWTAKNCRVGKHASDTLFLSHFVASNALTEIGQIYHRLDEIQRSLYAK